MPLKYEKRIHVRLSNISAPETKYNGAEIGSKLPKICIGLFILAFPIAIRNFAILVILSKTESPISFSVKPIMSKSFRESI